MKTTQTPDGAWIVTGPCEACNGTGCGMLSDECYHCNGTAVERLAGPLRDRAQADRARIALSGLCG